MHLACVGKNGATRMWNLTEGSSNLPKETFVLISWSVEKLKQRKVL